jgi:hypothetical protein
MEDLNYYTVMEKRIKYYAGKYDPENRFLNPQFSSLTHDTNGGTKKLSGKVSLVFNYLISILF